MMVGQARKISVASRWAGGGISLFLVLLLLFASYRPAVCLIGIFSLGPEGGRSAPQGIGPSSWLGGSQPTPTRQQSRTDPELRSQAGSAGLVRDAEPRTTLAAIPHLAGEGAALCLPVAIRLSDVSSRPAYLRPDDHPRPRPLAPPA